MSTDEMTERDWNTMEEFRQREVWPLVQARRYGEAIDVLQRRLGIESENGRQLYILRELSYLLTVGGRDDESLSVIRQMIEIDPDAPLNWARLAGWYFWGHGGYEGAPEALSTALNAIDEAVKRARVRDRHNLRQCLNERCRIAVAMKRWDLLGGSLREILETRREPGIQFEGDFLSRVPDKAVDPELMAAYKALLVQQSDVRSRGSSPN